MRKAIITTLFVIFSSISFGQEVMPEEPTTRQEYLRISKAQKVGAWILLGAGATLIAITAPGDIPFDKLALPVIGSGAAILTSVILFIASARNKRKGMALSTHIELHNNPELTLTGIKKFPAPALTMKVRF